jgi:hypothetical protein
MLEPKIQRLKVAGESPSPNGFHRVATFDVELTPDLTLLGCRLVKTPSGGLQAYPPDAKHGSRSAALSPAFRDHIADIAALALESSIVPHSPPAA